MNAEEVKSLKGALGKLFYLYVLAAREDMKRSFDDPFPLKDQYEAYVKNDMKSSGGSRLIGKNASFEYALVALYDNIASEPGCLADVTQYDKLVLMRLDDAEVATLKATLSTKAEGIAEQQLAAAIENSILQKQIAAYIAMLEDAETANALHYTEMAHKYARRYTPGTQLSAVCDERKYLMAKIQAKIGTMKVNEKTSQIIVKVVHIIFDRLLKAFAFAAARDVWFRGSTPDMGFIFGEWNDMLTRDHFDDIVETVRRITIVPKPSKPRKKKAATPVVASSSVAEGLGATAAGNSLSNGETKSETASSNDSTPSNSTRTSENAIPKDNIN